MNELYLDQLTEMMNLTGQWQPSYPPENADLSLDNQLLNELVLSDEIITDLPMTPITSPDISNALVDLDDPGFELFLTETTSSLTANSEGDSIGALISTPIALLSTENTIEENMDSLCLSQTHNDSFFISSSVQTGSSPVETKLVDNSISTNLCVRRRQTPYRNAIRSRRVADYHQPSPTVAPIDVLQRSSDSQYSASVQMTSEGAYSEQEDSLNQMIDRKKIQIIANPRAKFRPRTKNESRVASHYLRCEDDSSYQYPTIAIPREWALESNENFIQVSLVRLDNELHDYEIENKSSKANYEADALIFRGESNQSLYFRLVNDDFTNGCKSFNIELIKCRQNDVITKDRIERLKLDHSKLRFTRVFRTNDNKFTTDVINTAYSSVMCEKYGDIAVEHFGPLYGPLSGDKVYALLKGKINKQQLIIEVTEEVTGLHERPTFTKTGGLVYFNMPNMTELQQNRLTANIVVYYNGVELYQTNYRYTGTLDEELAQMSLSSTIASPSDDFDPVDFFSTINTAPIVNSFRRSTTSTKRTKRLQCK